MLAENVSPPRKQGVQSSPVAPRQAHHGEAATNRRLVTKSNFRRVIQLANMFNATRRNSIMLMSAERHGDLTDLACAAG